MTASELRKQTCCFTGHRDLPVHKTGEIAANTAREVRSLIINRGIRFFGVGGAIGYDTLAAQVLLGLRETVFPQIRVVLVYPFDGFTSLWTPQQKADYCSLLPKYDKIVCVSDTAGKQAYLARDRHLVDGSAYCISYCTRRNGGTAYTLRYAKSQGLEIHNISGFTLDEK